MKRLLLIGLLVIPGSAIAQNFTLDDIAKWTHVNPYAAEPVLTEQIHRHNFVNKEHRSHKPKYRKPLSKDYWYFDH